MVQKIKGEKCDKGGNREVTSICNMAQDSMRCKENALADIKNRRNIGLKTRLDRPTA